MSDRWLSPLELRILTALFGREAHGYALLKTWRDGPSVHLGSLYRVLNRLEAQGLLITTSGPERPRRFRVTVAGRRRLAREATRLRGLLSDIERELWGVADSSRGEELRTDGTKG